MTGDGAAHVPRTPQRPRGSSSAAPHRQQGRRWWVAIPATWPGEGDATKQFLEQRTLAMRGQPHGQAEQYPSENRQAQTGCHAAHVAVVMRRLWFQTDRGFRASRGLGRDGVRRDGSYHLEETALAPMLSGQHAAASEWMNDVGLVRSMSTRHRRCYRAHHRLGVVRRHPVTGQAVHPEDAREHEKHARRHRPSAPGRHGAPRRASTEADVGGHAPPRLGNDISTAHGGCESPQQLERNHVRRNDAPCEHAPHQDPRHIRAHPRG